MYSTPKFIQGIFGFEGAGLATPVRLGAAASYRVPADKRSQIVYVRAGSSADDLVTLALLRDGKLMRYFPIGAKQSIHVPLAVLEDLFPDNQLELQVVAPKGIVGTVVVDVGLLEVD